MTPIDLSTPTSSSQIEAEKLPLASTSNPQSQTQKRAHDSSHPEELEEAPAKRARYYAASPPWPTDDPNRDLNQSLGNSPYLFPRNRSSSPAPFSLLQAATAMLSRAEETGGNRIVKLARGTPGSPVPRSSPHPPSRNPSDQTTTTRPRAQSRSSSSGAHLLHSVALAEFLQQDDRPIFVVDIGDESHVNPNGLHLVFTNNALKKKQALLDHIQGDTLDPHFLDELGPPFVDFRSWVLAHSEDGRTIETFPFSGFSWRSSIVRKRLKIVTGYPSSEQVFPEQTESRSSTPVLSLTLAVPASTTSHYDTDADDVQGDAESSQPARLESLSPRSSKQSAPTPSGDLAHSELLASPFSSRKEQIVTAQPTKNFPERLEGIDVGIISDKGFFDWTRLPDLSTLPQHIQFARNVDWSTTSLGPIEEWAPDLRGMCNLIMASPHPAAMYWGQDHVAIYNEPYILLAGQKHPSLMGSRYCDAWAEIWDALKGVFENAYSNAQATMKDDDCLFIIRNGFLEETYFSWSIIPLIGHDGSVVGLYNPAFEKTRRKVAERRMLTLREIGERTAAARQVSQFWGLLLEGLSFNELDVPLAMVYSLGSENSEGDIPLSGSSSGAANKTARLEGTLGVTVGHPAAPPVMDLKTSNLGFAWTFRQALTQDKPIVLREEDGLSDPTLLEGIKWRGFGDPARVIVICPIHPTTGDSTLGFLVIGTNPRRPYDEDFDLFVQLLARQLATSVASVVLFEEEIRKSERAAKLAAQDRIELNKQLRARTQEAFEAENKFTRMAELAPVGMFIGDSVGHIVFVNDAWYELSSYPRDVAVQDDWIYYILEDDQPKAWQAWTAMLTKKCPISTEFRFKTPWRDKIGNTSYTWVLASSSPEKDEDGNIKRIFGSVTDISSQKFAENLQTKRMEEAVELKRQQERYIDTTSHEMRNPLSAILQSADAITGTLGEMRDANGLTSVQRELLDVTIESAQVISLCAQHQKRIVDDVLTLSKLDSAMMVVTPVDVQPVTVVERALKMFEGEFHTADIALEFRLDESYTTLNIDWVRIDPHRLSQVLINLTTNAIKFTTTQEKRTIQMSVAASIERPSQEDKWGLTYIPSQLSRDRDITASAEWGLGEPVYIHFAVQDTGRGLSELEKKQLFQRFSQANPRTHVHYGGSGLGLFISRELVELQGGEIGVASEAGKGSTFAFYIKARRSKGPTGADEPGTYNGLVKNLKGSRRTKSTKIKTQGFAGIPSATSSPSDSPIAMAVQPKQQLAPPPLHVLVVEDNLINQKVLAAQLRKIGCTVSVANHGGEAIDVIKNSTFYRRPANLPPPPLPSAATSSSSTSSLTLTTPSSSSSAPIPLDIVLMDLEMPIMDGVTCARKLRVMQQQGELVRHVPVIAVTANARAEQIETTLKSGIDDVVSKPFRVVELLPRMLDVVRRFAGAA